MIRFFPCLLCSVLVLLSMSLRAQCYGNAQAEAHVCAGTPISHSAYTQCPNCTYNWSANPISGQGTATATYIWTPTPSDGHSYSYPSMSGFNPNANCSYYDMFQTTVGRQPNYSALPLVNGPWNGDTAKVWIYTRSRSSMYTSMNYGYNPSWTASGGQIVRSNIFHWGPGQQYHEDSVYVKWQSYPMVLNEARSTYHYGNYGWQFNCNWSPIQVMPNYPTLAIFHPNVCQGNLTSFYTFPFSGSTYTWSITNGSVVSGQGTNSVQLIVNGPSTVTVQRDSSGVITSATSPVTPFVPVMNLGADFSYCPNSPPTLTANPGFTSYLWSTGATSQSIVVASPGQYHVTGTLGGACTASDTINVSAYSGTPVNLGPDIHQCTGGATLDAGPGYSTYQWSTGSTAQVITVPTAGMFMVTVSDANGCTSSDLIQVWNHQPTVNLGPDANYCVGAGYTVSASVTQTMTYLWSTGATTPTIQVNSLGPQTIWLQVSNSYGCTTTDTVVLTGNASPTPTLGPNQTVCPGTPVVLTPGGGYASYYWSNFSNQSSITVVAPGTYTVTVTDAIGCTGTASVSISNYPLTPVNLGPDVFVCQPSMNLDAGPGYGSYTWSNGATTQSINVTQGGLYSVTVTTVNGCTSSDDINCTFSNFSFSLGPDQNVCEPSVVTLDPQLVGNYTYSWSTGATSPTLTMTAPTTAQVVVLNASNNLGCANTDTVVVTILPTPPSTLGADTLLCMDTTITLSLGPGFSSYLWSNNATTQSITVTSGGSYRVTATAPNGCVRLDTVNISQMIDCVFPGDVDYDGVANAMDVLALGTAYGMNGSIRPGASLQWYGQWAQTWGGSIASGADFKQGDTNGDGQININDTLAIQLNFGSTHNKVGGITGGSETIRFQPVNSSITAGDTAEWDVILTGTGFTDLDSVSGLALTFDWPTNLATGLVYANMDGAWFAPGNNRLTLTRPENSKATLAITRISHTDTSGQGLVMRIGLATNPNLQPGQVATLLPTVTSATVVGNNLQPRTATDLVTPVDVLGPVANQPQIVTHVSVWPVPATEKIHVFAEGVMPTEVQLMDMLGRTVGTFPWGMEDVLEIPVSKLTSGNYCLKVQTPQGVLSKVVQVGR